MDENHKAFRHLYETIGNEKKTTCFLIVVGATGSSANREKSCKLRIESEIKFHRPELASVNKAP